MYSTKYILRGRGGDDMKKNTIKYIYLKTLRDIPY